jgi:hypothetical protein
MEEIRNIIEDDYLLEDFPQFAHLIKDNTLPNIAHFHVFTEEYVYVDLSDGNDNFYVSMAPRNPQTLGDAK